MFDPFGRMLRSVFTRCRVSRVPNGCPEPLVLLKPWWIVPWPISSREDPEESFFVVQDVPDRSEYVAIDT